MKRFFIALILFILIIGLIIMNSVYMNKKTGYMLFQLNDLSIDQETFDSEINIESIDEIYAEWENNKIVFDFSLNKELFELAEENIINISEYAKTADYSDYKKSYEVLYDTILRIKEFSSVSFVSIF